MTDGSLTWIGTSWKMNGSLAFARAYATGLRARAGAGWPGIQPFVIPPATALAVVSAVLRPGTGVLLGAQNAHWEQRGAWTGELSVEQVADAGATLVEIGHSERRAWFGDTDELVHRKVLATLRAGLRPLVCVGESAEDFAAGRSAEVVTAQVSSALAGVTPDQRPAPIVAYEPIWAIGDHGREATPEDIAATVATIAERFGDRLESVLYGGSVNRQNLTDILDVPGVGGAFVGRAAWTLTGYLDLLDLASEHLACSDVPLAVHSPVVHHPVKLVDH